MKEHKTVMKQEIHDIFIKTNQIKLFFQHDMAYEDFKDSVRRTASDKILDDKIFNIAKIHNMMDIKEVLL